MNLSKIQSQFEKIEKDPFLFEERNFEKRQEGIEFIDFQILQQIDDLILKTGQAKRWLQLKLRAEKIKGELEKINFKLFQQLRERIRNGEIAGEKFKNLIHDYIVFDLEDTEHQDQIEYENLDVLVNGLSPFSEIPGQTRDLEPEMVYYQKTPARIVFEMIEKSPFQAEDVFFDLGSGLGQVAILVHLLTGLPVRGIEIEPSFCQYARDWAVNLHLPAATFQNGDARFADLSCGTVFFMFTPFKGVILSTVLENLRKESGNRRIKIITYGPCTIEVGLQNWLVSDDKVNNIYQLTVFHSR